MRFRPRYRRPHAASASYTPAQIALAYQFPTGVTLQSGQTDPVIAIIELGGGYTPSDTASVFAKWGLLAPSVTIVSVQGAQSSPGTDADGEVALDVQVAAAIYAYCTGRAAQVRLYFAPNTSAGFAAAIAQAAADGCSVCSISWGGPESQGAQYLDAAIQQCLAAGCPVFAAAGDNDSGDGTGATTVDYPASSPYVVGCGGTTHVTGSVDTVWNDGTNGTGGGFSATYPRPSWQPADSEGQGRMVPDLAGDADPNTGYAIVVDGQSQVIGGTSAVAPLMAGLFGAITVMAGKKLGNILPALWANPGAFTDVTEGNNGAYTATVGPDPCTGMGVPIGTELAAVFTGTATGPLPPPPPPPEPPVTPTPPPPEGVVITPAQYAAVQATDRAVSSGRPLKIVSAARAQALAFAGGQPSLHRRQHTVGTSAGGEQPTRRQHTLGATLTGILAYLEAHGVTLKEALSVSEKIVEDLAAGEPPLEILDDVLLHLGTVVS